MPNIEITESEDLRLSAFDSSSNAVLIPIVYKRSLQNEEVYTREFTSIETFHNVYKNNHYNNDRSYIMANELLLQNMPVVVKPIFAVGFDSEGELAESQLFDIVHEEIVENDGYSEFKDRNIFNLKFITSGAWPNIGKAEIGMETYESLTMYATLAAVAEARGDAIALVEYGEQFTTDEEFLAEAFATDINECKYTACTFPWAQYNTSVKRTVSNKDTYIAALPGCFGYLMAYANSVKSNANWFAAAGIIRGVIPNLLANGVNVDVHESTMHILQGDIDYQVNRSTKRYINTPINVIYNAGTFGYKLWGNRVFWNESVSTETYFKYLNVRILLCDIKKQIFNAAMRTTFEPNDDITWLNFKSLSNTLLDKMKSGRGIKWYKWVKEDSSLGTIKARLRVQPIEAVENFEINVFLTDDETSVTEGKE